MKVKPIFPPRPENAVPAKNLNRFVGRFVAQPKLNGSYAQIWTDGKSVIVWNRHKGSLSNFKLDKQQILDLHTGKGWICFLGEYMNKSKKDQNNEVFNHKFCIFDVACYGSKMLTKSTFEYRQKFLDKLLGKASGYLNKISQDVYRIGNIDTDFDEAFAELTKTDMYEGLVIKMKLGILDRVNQQTGNKGWQIKSRKPTKNYKF